MPESARSWGLNKAARRTVLGIRAAGLFLMCLGIPAIGPAVNALVIRATFGTTNSSMGFFSFIQTKEFVVTFLSSTGPYLLAVVAGIYLMRCDPRPLLRSAGVTRE